MPYVNSKITGKDETPGAESRPAAAAHLGKTEQGGNVSEFLRPMAEWCAAIIEAIGIGIIALIALYALFDAAILLLRKEETERIFMELRQQLGRGILIGLEFLIAADIIHTVAVELTFETVGVLALVVVVRTFLSFALEVELTGRWPWHRGK